MRRSSWPAAALVVALALAIGAPAVAQPAATPDTQFDFANGLFQRGHYHSAADAYATFLDMAPDDPRAEAAMFRLGESHYALQQYAEALQAYRTVIHRWPDGAKTDAARLRVGQCALARGEREEAIREITTLLERPLDNAVRAAALYALGQAYYEDGKAAQATEAFTRLAALPGDSEFVPFANYYLGYLKWEAGDPAAAHVHFKAFANQAKDDALAGEALVRAGETALGMHKPAVAAEAFTDSLKHKLTPDLQDAAAVGLAWAQYQAGHYQDALGVRQAWLDRVSAPAAKAELQYVAGEAAFELKDYPRASMELTAALKGAEGRIRDQTQLRLAWVHYLMEDYDACARVADAALAAGVQAPGAAEELSYLAAAARFGAENFAVARDGLRAFVDQYPKSGLRADALYQLGVCEQVLGDLAAAQQAFDRAIEAGDPAARGARALFKAGEVRYGQEDYAGAADYWARILKEYPNDPLAADAQFRLGLARYKLEDWAGMEAAFAAFRDAHPKHELATEAAYWLGWARQREEKWAAAAEAFSVVTQDRGAEHYADALARQALCAYQAEQEGQAAILYVRFLREIPDRQLPRDVLFWLGHFMREKGEWQSARFVYERAMVQHPTDDVIEAARYEIGQCLYVGKKYEEAMAAFDRVLSDFPNGAYAAKAQLGRGRIFQAQRRYAEAIEALTTAAQLDEGAAAAEANLRLGQCYEAEGKLREAKDRYLFLTVVFDAPEFAGEAYLGAGRCLEQLEETDEAVKTYREFVERYPDDPAVADAQARLNALAPAAPAPTAEEGAPS